MQLINNFFEIVSTSSIEGGFVVTIKLNPSHIVYKGHFPGHPVTPGVILLQIVHELLEHYFEKKLKLLTINQCKFLHILNPEHITEVDIHITFVTTDEILNVKAKGDFGNTIYFKLQSVYQL